METCCNQNMELVAVYDDPQKTIRAYNLYMCTNCGKIKKIDVWEGAGITEIDIENNVKSTRGIDDQ